MMYDPTDGTKVPQVLWGEITESQLQSTSTQQDSKPTQAAQRLSSIPSCNKLLPLEKTSFDKYVLHILFLLCVIVIKIFIFFVS